MERPRLTIKTSKVEWLIELLCLLTLASVIYVLLTRVNSLPARIPLHYDLSGNPDRWGTKTSIWILPGIAFFIYLLMTVITNYPHIFNYPYEITPENALRQYTNSRWLVRVTKMLALFQISYAVVAQAIGNHEIGRYFVLLSLVPLLGAILFFVIRGYTLR